MTVAISEELKLILAEKETLKALASVDKDGVPHVVFKGSIQVAPEGHLTYLEILESSQTNKNLTHALWFDRVITINVVSKERRSFQIKGKPRKVHVAGPLFEQKYLEVNGRVPGADLSGVWEIEPLEVREQTFGVRLAQQKRDFPFIGHLDQDLK